MLISPSVGPATLGLVSPRIVIPHWSTELPTEELDLILTHESEHVRTRDPLLLAAGLLGVVACPWNPVVWWQIRRLKGAIEVDCDRRVLRRGVAADQYGQLLVRLGMRGTTAPFALPTIGGPISQLERRLKIMLKSRQGGSLTAAIAAMAAGVMLVAGACTTDAPVGANMAVQNQSPAAEAARPEVVPIWIDRSGQVHVNGTVQPVEDLSEAVGPLYTPETVVSLEAHVAAPYSVVAAVQEELQQAGLVRIVFVRAETDRARPAASDPDRLSESGLAAVLPELDDLIDIREVAARNPTNILFLDVRPNGTVAVRRGADPAVNVVQPPEVEALWRAEVAANPSLIALVETHPEAEYRHMYGVLDALQRANATRFSLQVAD